MNETIRVHVVKYADRDNLMMRYKCPLTGKHIARSTGTTNSQGVFQTSWIKGLADDTYTANVTDLALAGFFWNDLLDEEDDTDGDGWPDDIFALF